MKSQFAAALALSLLASSAFAADAVMPDVLTTYGASYSWSGLYIGAQAGAGFGGDQADTSYTAARGALFPTSSFSSHSGDDDAQFIGGVHIGYDYQADTLLIGVVADINYFDATRTSTYTFGSAARGFDTFGVRQSIDFVATGRGKVGFAADRFALYATGGIAYGDVDTTFVRPATTRSTRGFTTTATVDSDDVGYAVGAGADYLVTRNLSFGLEYLYTDLGETTTKVTYTNAALPVAQRTFSATTSGRTDFHSVWAKASLRFN